MTGADRVPTVQGPRQPKEILDAVRRHVCHVLGFDYALIDVVRDNQAVNVLSFCADADASTQAGCPANLIDSQKQPLTLAQSLLADKVRKTKVPFVGQATAADNAETSYPYVIVPMLSGAVGHEGEIRGLLRVISFSSTRQISETDLSTLKLFAAHLAGKLPDLVQAAQSRDKGELTTPGAETVLIVHGNRLVRRRMARALRPHYNMLECDTGAKVLAELELTRIDIMIVDHQAESASGRPLYTILCDSTRWKHIPLILMTPQDNLDAKIRGLNAGADDCLSETCHEAELRARVRASLRLRKTERDLATQSQLLEDYAQRLEQEFEKERSMSSEAARRAQTLEQRNRELKESRWKEQMLLGQAELMQRVSDGIRESINFNDNVSGLLEELGGHFNLDSCFIIVPADEPEDACRAEYTTDSAYSVTGGNLDLRMLDIFGENFRFDQSIIVSDITRDRTVDPFRKDIFSHYPVQSLFLLPVSYDEQLLGILGGMKCEKPTLWSVDNKSFFNSLIGQVSIGVANSRLYARVQRQATTDGLTGLYNHRTGQEKLAEQIRLAARYQRKLSVMMLDIDHFKSINDTYGHPAGDMVLQTVARIIRSDCRDVDIPVRYGGEEFLVILPEVNQAGAVALAERLRRKLAAEVIRHEKIEIAVTGSIGIATYPDDADEQQKLLALADKALYMSKRLGRNRVHVAADLAFREAVAPQETPAQAAGEAPLPASPVASPPRQAVESKAMAELTPAQTPASEAAPAEVQQQTAAEIGPPPPKLAAQPEPGRPALQVASATDRSVVESRTVAAPETAARAQGTEGQTLTTPPAPAPSPGGTRPGPGQHPVAAESEAPQEGPGEERLLPEVVEMVKAMAQALYSRSEYNKEHHLESARFAELLAKVMGLTQQQIEQVRVASLLHDVGILSLPDELLNKQGPVTDQEMHMISQHPALGADMLRPINALKEICEIVENHHECWDGTGYPRGLRGEEIPLPARIVAIVDSYHAMISDRPWRAAMTEPQARKALQRGAGTQWDPFLVDMFLAMLSNLDREKAGKKGS